MLTPVFVKATMCNGRSLDEMGGEWLRECGHGVLLSFVVKHLHKEYKYVKKN